MYFLSFLMLLSCVYASAQDDPCEGDAIQFPNELPDSICVDADTLYFLGAGDVQGSFDGELVISNDNGFFIDAAEAEAGNTTTVYFSAEDSCGEMQTIEQDIPLVECEETCEAEPIRFPNELPDSICVDADTLYFLGGSDVNGSFEGELIVSNDNGTVLDASGQEAGNSTTIYYSAEDNCGDFQTIEAEIPLVECDTCGEVSIQGDIPEQLCLDDDALFLASYNVQAFISINIENNESGYFSGHTQGEVFLFPSEVGEGTTIIEYTALNDCEEEETVIYTVEIIDCDEPECEPFNFNDALSDDVCLQIDEPIAINATDVSNYSAVNTSGNGTDELNFYPADAGESTHIITFTGTNECGDEIVEEIEVHVIECQPTSIESSITAADINLFPNPATKNTVITVDGVDATFIEVYNTQNQKVVAVDGANKLSTASLPSGLYIVRITLENGEQIAKRLMIK